MLNEGEKMPFGKILVILAKLLQLCEMSSSSVNKIRGALRNINHFIGGHNLFQTKRPYLLNEGEKTTFRKIVIILAKLLLCVMSSSSVNKMRGAQILQNINDFNGGHNLFQTKRTYLLNKG